MRKFVIINQTTNIPDFEGVEFSCYVVVLIHNRDQTVNIYKNIACLYETLIKDSNYKLHFT